MCGSRSHPRIPRIYSWEYVNELVKAAWPMGHEYEDTGRSIESCVEDLDFCWGDHMIYADIIE